MINLTREVSKNFLFIFLHAEVNLEIDLIFKLDSLVSK